MKVEMRNIKKSFGSNNVLKGVSLSVQGGEICGLLGENGAGKSTLMNILGGVHQMDEGSIVIDGETVRLKEPSDSLDCGIAFIHQELNLINDLPIYENMFLGRELKTKRGTIDHGEMIKQTREMFHHMNIDLDPHKMVESLDTSYKQIVEISRAMMTNASLIIMDEPTTSLTGQEIERVFDMMRTMKKRDVGIIFISHKLNEVKQICSNYAVLRDGNLVSEGEVSDVSTDDLARFMVGFDVRTESLRREKVLGEEILRLENVSSEPSFRNINLSVKAGEILGVTGLLGDGRSELFQSIFGANKPPAGKIFIRGNPVSIHRTDQAMRHGIGYLPRNRKENAILKDMTIFENASVTTWSAFSTGGVIDSRRHSEVFEQHRNDLNIKMEKPGDSITSLSGGNQQKVVLAKWLATNPDILILDNPTQGVDVGSKEEIYDIILKLAEEKIAVIVLSGEAQEIIRLCDRALVMYHGNMQGEVTGDDMTEHSIMRLATGSRVAHSEELNGKYDE